MGIALPREERTGAGLLLMALAVTFFICIDTSAKWLTLSGLPALQIVFARYAGHFAVALGYSLATEGPSALRSNRPWLQLARSAALLGSTVFNFLALGYLPITVTTTIMFGVPILVTLLAIPILGERVGIRRIAAVCTGFAGVLVVMQPWGAEFHPAMLYSLSALVCASFYFILTRMLAGVEANATQQIWASGLATVAILPFAFAVWVRPETGTQWTVLCAIGVFGAVGHAAATLAHRLADASILSPVVYIQVVLAAVAGVLVFDTWPTIWTLAGAAIIIASGLYIWQRERVRAV